MPSFPTWMHSHDLLRWSLVRACLRAGVSGLLVLMLAGCSYLLLPPSGLWIENEGSNRTLDAKERIDEMLAIAKTHGISELFVQVHRGNRSWYASKLADDAPSRRAAIPGYRDPLQYLISRARELNLRVHAWVNVFRIAANLEAPILRRLGRQVVLVDSNGVSLLDYENFRVPGEPGRYFILGTPGYWLDPGSERVQRYLLDVLAELVSSYPQLDGVHLDFIRYPMALPSSPGTSFGRGVDFGYGAESRRSFHAETGQEVEWRDGRFEAPRQWGDWRRRQVTRFMRRARHIIKGRSPEMAFSAAVIPWADRAYLSAFQDWRGWMDEELVDFCVVMIYSRDRRLVRHLSRQAVAVQGGSRVYIGLGAYLLVNSPDKLRAQLAIVRNFRPDGIVLFSYDAMLKRRSMFSMLNEPVADEKKREYVEYWLEGQSGAP